METKGTEINYTHIIFHYKNGSKMTVNKFTYKHVFPNEKKIAKSFKYIIRD